MLLTLFTATYNRVHTLPRLYASIRQQTWPHHDFEWVIVDDGSTDGTGDLVRRWQTDHNDFEIRYFWQPNQHKKVAFNRGVREARGRFFHNIDSDDALLPDTVRFFITTWLSLSEEQLRRCSAVVGMCVDEHGRVIGDRFPMEPFWASDLELFFDHNIVGEKRACHRTEVLRAFPFPEHYPGLVPEMLIWFKIAEQYTQACFNTVCNVYYQDVPSIVRCRATTYREAARFVRNSALAGTLHHGTVLRYATWRRFALRPVKVLSSAIYFVYFRLWLLGHPHVRWVQWPRSVLSLCLLAVSAPLGFARWCAKHFQLIMQPMLSWVKSR